MPRQDQTETSPRAAGDAPGRRSDRHRAARSTDGRRSAAGPQGVLAERAARAELAAHSVEHLFLHPLLGVPGTLIGETTAPPTKGLRKKLTGWNYWWQAHLLDAIVDAGQREHASSRTEEADGRVAEGERLLRGIKWHNAGIWQNSYYDDMAWLTLAAGRLNALSTAVRGRGSALAQEAGRALYPTLAEAVTEDLGGGAYWSTAQDFKNVPATAPIALAFSRAGRDAEAAPLRAWLRDHLFDPQQGYLDGLHVVLERDATVRTSLDTACWSYNQGTALAATLAGTDPDLAHAAQLVEIVARTQTQTVEAEGTEVRVLITDGHGDAGLFAGILGRYLAEAALDARLPEHVRETAAELVLATAEMLWAGRREFDPDLPLNEPGIDVTEIRGQAVALFSPDATRHASRTLGVGVRAELSSQVMAWTFLEAAWRLA